MDIIIALYKLFLEMKGEYFMTNLQVYKKIDKKCKLYVTNTIVKSIGIVATSGLAANGLQQVVLNFSQSPELINAIGSFGVCGFIAICISYAKINSNDFLLYRQIKKDLENGINDFENVEEENFEKTLGSYQLPNRTK